MPGIAPLIQNLVSSISAKASSGIRNKDLAEWQREYLTGLTQEIYSVPLPRHFRGRTFTDLSLELYRRYSLLLFGLERIRGGRLHVVLSPGRPEAIQRGDVGFFIAEDQLQMEQMLTDAVAAGHRREKTHSNFGRRTVPQWAKRLFSSRVRCVLLCACVVCGLFVCGCVAVLLLVHDVYAHGNRVASPTTNTRAEWCAQIQPHP